MNTKVLYPNYEPGMRVAKLVLLEEVYKMDSTRKRKCWKCKCLKCGKEFVAREDAIKRGDQISCGCIGKSYRSRWLHYGNK